MHSDCVNSSSLHWLNHCVGKGKEDELWLFHKIAGEEMLNDRSSQDVYLCGYVLADESFLVE